MSKADNNEQTDADILQCKEDILRARDIIPGTPKRDKGDLPPLPLSAGKKESEIPTFDLAEDIMTEQRKTAASRRKAPGKKTEDKSQELQVEAIGYAIGQPILEKSEQDRIIAEIIARDIERLRRGNTSGGRR